LAGKAALLEQPASPAALTATTSNAVSHRIIAASQTCFRKG